MASDTESDLATIAYMAGVADEKARRRAAVAELVKALERIRDLSPAVTHGWAVEARNIATTALSRHQAGLGKGDDRG